MLETRSLASTGEGYRTQEEIEEEEKELQEEGSSEEQEEEQISLTSEGNISSISDDTGDQDIERGSIQQDEDEEERIQGNPFKRSLGNILHVGTFNMRYHSLDILRGWDMDRYFEI
jgi:hypothetical protein